MTSSQPFILIKKQAKALQIEHISQESNGVYAVKFKNSPNIFHYRSNDVVILKDSVWHDHLNCKVFIGGREQKDVADIQSFRQGNLTHWRITFSNGYIQDYLDGSIRVEESCLADDIAKNSFEYLKRVAQTNELGKDEEHGGILSALYEKIDFIDKEFAAAPYLDAEKYAVKKSNASHLIFPFGCNASQEKAVVAAFENQISVIQGPPGTGKTQTILNIIANILMQGKTVMVVSNNNSATLNVLEKLRKHGLDFIVAPLGKRENKEEFIRNQPVIPVDLQDWQYPMAERMQKRSKVKDVLTKLRRIFSLQEELATSKQKLNAVELEWEHFKNANQIDGNTYQAKKWVKAQRFMKLWLRYQSYSEGDYISPQDFLGKLKERVIWAWLNITRKYLLGVKSPFNPTNIWPTIQELQALYYQVRIKELNSRINTTSKELANSDSASLISMLTTSSMALLRNALYDRYHNKPRRVYQDAGELWLYKDEVCMQYPVILSTTFSARTTLPETVYDFVIMDEASQVSIETGALALTCARNAVIVGDTLQLPNVVTEDDRQRLNAIFEEYKVPQGYNCAEYSFLQSVCTVLPQIKQTLLREHYRCHPKIINFCNQRFYGGQLVIMTEDQGEENVMMAVRTKPGHHARGHYNQREIDVVREELLPQLGENSEIGIITPYNAQVNEFNKQIPAIEAATVHKYQGREKDTIVMSTVDDQITEFSDDPNLLNVAISRAKRHFCLVVTGNEQERKGNVAELIDYIGYNNFTVSESRISSIFDFLYSEYTAERIEFLRNHKSISAYDSENLTYSLIESILTEHTEFAHLGVLCHTPLRTILKDWSLMNDDERRYVSHYSTHLDFLIINHVTKKPILAIETDGYNFHHEETGQHHRDLMKNHILDVYGVPLLRLSTTGSREKEKILTLLTQLVNINNN